MPKRVRRFWTVEEAGEERFTYTTIDEVVSAYLDELSTFPECLTVREYAPMKVTKADMPYILDRVLESLDDEYGDPEGDNAEATPLMRKAEEQFIKVILREYQPWACEKTGRVRKINVKRWLAGGYAGQGKKRSGMAEYERIAKVLEVSNKRLRRKD